MRRELAPRWRSIAAFGMESFSSGRLRPVRPRRKKEEEQRPPGGVASSARERGRARLAVKEKRGEVGRAAGLLGRSKLVWAVA